MLWTGSPSGDRTTTCDPSGSRTAPTGIPPAETVSRRAPVPCCGSPPCCDRFEVVRRHDDGFVTRGVPPSYEFREVPRQCFVLILGPQRLERLQRRAVIVAEVLDEGLRGRVSPGEYAPRCLHSG